MTLRAIPVISMARFNTDVSRATYVPRTCARHDNRTVRFNAFRPFQLFLPWRTLSSRYSGDGRRESVSHLTIFNFSRA